LIAAKNAAKLEPPPAGRVDRLRKRSNSTGFITWTDYQ
jgi:hypothetical protein